MKCINEFLDEDFLIRDCNYDIRQAKGCTDLFLQSGFLKNLCWDTWAEYNLLCNQCNHFSKNIGIYFGSGKTSMDFEKQSTFFSLCPFRSQEDFEAAIKEFPSDHVNKLYISGNMTNLKPIEELNNIELLVVGYGVKLEKLWNMSKTPKIKELHICGAKKMGNLQDLITTTSLEHLGFEIITSQTGLSYVDSFQFLKQIPTLRALSLSGTMAKDRNIDDLIAIPNLKELWISPNTYTTEDFAKFEALKFKIYDEYGIYQNNDFCCPLGFGKSTFRSDKAKEKYKKEYDLLMEKWSHI